MNRRSGSRQAREVVVERVRGPAMAAIAFDLDERDLLAIDEYDHEGSDDTVIDIEPDDDVTSLDVAPRYPPGLDDDALHFVVARLTSELCGRSSATRRRRA